MSSSNYPLQVIRLRKRLWRNENVAENSFFFCDKGKDLKIIFRLDIKCLVEKVLRNIVSLLKLERSNSISNFYGKGASKLY